MFFCGSYTMQRYDCSGVVGSLWRDKDWKKERKRNCAVHMNMLDECEYHAECRAS